MASGNSTLENFNTENLKRTYSERNRDYDGLKKHELQLLRRQNSESSRQSSKEIEYFRNQHLVTMSQLEAEETSALRNKYSEIVPDKQRTDRDIPVLRSSCCNQPDIAVKENGGTETFNNRYLVTINKYEALKEDYEALRQQYDDLIAARNNAVDKIDFKQEEINRLKQQLDDMIVEHNNVVLERNGLQQQCTQAVHKWDMTLRERKDLQDALKKMQSQFEEAMNARMKTSKDMKRLTEDRNAAMHEYSLIMGERDSVHKEMEKLTEDLSRTVKKNKILENQIKEYADQKKALSYHIETLKREIESALNDRDEALKECNDFRNKFGEYTAKEESHREAFKSIFDHSYNCERDFDCKDLNEMGSTSMVLLSKCQKESMHNLDQANQEIERLRKCIDKQQVELQEAVQEAEVSKRRRDWAFNERDKVVVQRDAMKTMYEHLRKDRDRDKINLAEALRDSDELTQQLGDAKKELQAVKEKIETDKGNRLLQLNTTGHNYSHDSAIDTDLQEWDTEMLNIDLNTLPTVEDIGVELSGGRDDPSYPNDSGIYVSSISRGSVLEGKLKVNDCILRVNNLDCNNVSRKMLIDAICSSARNCNILVKRRRIGARSLFTTQLQLNNYDHGLLLETGVYICKIAPGSLAAKEGNLAVGDRVLSINNKPLDGFKNVQDAMAILNDPTDILVITTLKSTHCSSNCGDGSNRDMFKKYTNSSTQTEQRSNIMNHTFDIRENRQSYPVACKSEIGKVPSNINTLYAIAREKDLSCRHRSLIGDKKSNQPSSPVTFDQERDDAIAELDSVIESYHSKHSNRQQPKELVTEQSIRLKEEQLLLLQKASKKKDMEKNGGTWPKARMGPIITHPTGTVLHVRKNRDRFPLKEFLNQTSNYSVPQTCFTKADPEDVCSSVSKDMSLDFSVKSGTIGKDVLEFYAKKNSSKYAMTDIGDLPDGVPHTRAHSQIYTPYTLPTFARLETRCDPQLADSRYPSSNIQSSQSGESLPLMEHRTYLLESSYSTLDRVHHQHSPSMDSPYQKATQTIGTSRSHPHCGELFYPDLPARNHHRYQGGTFPRKKENERLRIPFSSSKNSPKLPMIGVEKTSERGSPMPTFHVDVLDQRQSKRNSLPCWSYKPPIGQERRVTIENSAEPLGISIKCLESGPVFVSGVTKHSVASQVGLQVGDQLLEVCGINMRNASYKWAERVLGQCSNSNTITLHVQYNPHKYSTASCTSCSDSSATSGDDGSRSDFHSGSPTPCNSPEMNRKSTPPSLLGHSPYIRTITTLKKTKPSEKMDTSDESKARYLRLETHKCSNLGISLVGGNAVGIYVHSVAPNSLAYTAGLRTGDHILEYNRTDLRQATAEEAAFELAKPTDLVTVLVQSEIERYNHIKDKPGDSFYIRALFDRVGDLGDHNQLQFHKDDILYVDNTMLNGVPGNWKASLIDQQNGQTQQWGIIPSKYKIEEELLKRSLSDLEGDARRGTRRSFFRRKKQRNDSKELASFSNISTDWFNDLGRAYDEAILASYQKVVRLDTKPMLRPVLIVGPLADCVTEKLLADYPDKFNRCIPEVRYSTQVIMEKSLTNNMFIDYRKKGNAFECVTIASLKESINEHCHCILDINLASVRRLQVHHIYPIVLLIKFKSTKQIKEVRDTRYLSDKTSAKAAKEMYEHALKLESEYSQDISVVIPAGVNVAFMCTQIKAAVDQEQNKTIWVPASAI